MVYAVAIGIQAHHLLDPRVLHVCIAWLEPVLVWHITSIHVVLVLNRRATSSTASEVSSRACRRHMVMAVGSSFGLAITPMQLSITERIQLLRPVISVLFDLFNL